MLPLPLLLRGARLASGLRPERRVSILLHGTGAGRRATVARCRSSRLAAVTPTLPGLRRVVPQNPKHLLVGFPCRVAQLLEYLVGGFSPSNHRRHGEPVFDFPEPFQRRTWESPSACQRRPVVRGSGLMSSAQRARHMPRASDNTRLMRATCSRIRLTSQRPNRSTAPGISCQSGLSRLARPARLCALHRSCAGRIHSACHSQRHAGRAHRGSRSVASRWS